MATGATYCAYAHHMHIHTHTVHTNRCMHTHTMWMHRVCTDRTPTLNLCTARLLHDKHQGSHTSYVVNFIYRIYTDLVRFGYQLENSYKT